MGLQRFNVLLSTVAHFGAPVLNWQQGGEVGTPKRVELWLMEGG